MFTLTLTNFLGETAAETVVVAVDAGPLPVVTILGARLRRAPRGARVALDARAAPSCAAGAGGAGLTYAWSAKDGAGADIDVGASSESDPRAFVVRAHATAADGFDVVVAVSDGDGQGRKKTKGRLSSTRSKSDHFTNKQI